MRVRNELITRTSLFSPRRLRKEGFLELLEQRSSHTSSLGSHMVVGSLSRLVNTLQTVLVGPTQGEKLRIVVLGQKKNRMMRAGSLPCPSRPLPNCLVTAECPRHARRSEPGVGQSQSQLRDLICIGQTAIGQPSPRRPVSCALPVEKRGGKSGVAAL